MALLAESAEPFGIVAYLSTTVLLDVSPSGRSNLGACWKVALVGILTHFTTYNGALVDWRSGRAC